jgi:AP2-associated kinase
MTSTIGSINERGIIKGFERKGFTPEKCLSEIVANSIDARAPKVTFIITSTHIDVIDWGNGMTHENAQNMLDLHRENHGTHKALGVSGLGWKPASFILSGKQMVLVYTRVSGGESLCVEVPWGHINASGKYTGMSSCYPAHFPDEYSMMESGTIIRFPYTPLLENTIDSNFMDNTIPIMDRMSVIFGQFSTEINYNNKNKNPNKTYKMDMYNYFGGTPNEYYTGRVYEDCIRQYKDPKNGSDLFLWKNSLDDETYYIPKATSGYSKHKQVYKSSMVGWDFVGEYVVSTGMRKKPAYFDINNPRIPDSHERIFSDYDKDHIGEDFDIMAKCKVARNKQLIGYFEWPNLKTTSGRGNVKGMHNTFHTNCYLSYAPISTSDNIQDITIGIQENKNQYNGDAIPLNLRRLVEEIRNQTADIIWKYFEDLVSENLPVEDPVEEPVVHVEYPVEEPHGEPVIQVKDPVEEPVIHIEVPVEEPVVQVDEPVVQVDEPVVQVDEPVVQVDEPHEEPVEDPNVSHSDINSESSSSDNDSDTDDSIHNVSEHTRILVKRKTAIKMLNRLIPHAEQISSDLVEMLCTINGKEGDKVLKQTFEVIRRLNPELLLHSICHLYEELYSDNEPVRCGSKLYQLYNLFIMNM